MVSVESETSTGSTEHGRGDEQVKIEGEQDLVKVNSNAR